MASNALCWSQGPGSRPSLSQCSGRSIINCHLGCTYTITQPHAQHRAPVFIVSLVGPILLLEMRRVGLPLSLGYTVLAEQTLV